METKEYGTQIYFVEMEKFIYLFSWNVRGVGWRVLLIITPTRIVLVTIRTARGAGCCLPSRLCSSFSCRLRRRPRRSSFPDGNVLTLLLGSPLALTPKYTRHVLKGVRIQVPEGAFFHPDER